MSSANRPPKTLAQRIAIVLPDKHSLIFGVLISALMVVFILVISCSSKPSATQSPAPINYRVQHLTADDGTDCYALVSTSNTPYGFDCKN